MAVDLFERIKIAAMSNAEKLELMERGDEYLLILSKDDALGIRLRAKVRLHETDEDQASRRKEDLAYLEEEAKSGDFGRRIKAKALLRRFHQMEGL